MPRLTKANGDIVEYEKYERAWITIPFDKNEIDRETFLVNPKLADYIITLEEEVKSLRPQE